MKTLIGFFLVLLGLALGVYAGLCWAFIGGIVEIVHSVQSTPTDGLQLACGLARVLLANVIGVMSALVFIAPGMALIKSD